MLLTPVPQNTSTTTTADETFVAGENLSGHQVLMLVAGKVYKADPSTALPDQIVGISRVPASINQQISVLKSGILNGFSTLTPDATYFVGPNGSLITTRPTSGLLMKVGVAEDAQNLVLNFSTGVILG